MADLDDVHQQATLVGHALARHVGARHPPVLLRRRLDGVHRRSARDEVTSLSHIARRVHGRYARSQMRIDPDPPFDDDTGILEPLEVRPDTGGHDDDVGHEVRSIRKAQALAASNVRPAVPSPTSSMLTSWAPVRMLTPLRINQSATNLAPVSSTMRGRMRGAISTMVSWAPRARMEFRMVKAMKPAPTITT